MAVTKPLPGTTRYKAMTQQAFRLNIVSAQVSTELSAPQARNGVDAHADYGGSKTKVTRLPGLDRTNTKLIFTGPLDAF